MAASRSPNAAFEEAQANHYTTEETQSCRFLAMIRRDHGQEDFDATIGQLKDQKLREYLEQKVIPSIEILEKVAGAPLRIVEPHDRGLTLIEYLRQECPTGFNLGLALGKYKVTMKWVIDKQEYEGTISHQHAGGYTLTAPDGREVVKEGWRNLRDIPPEQLHDMCYLQKELCHFLVAATSSLSGWPHKSMLLMLREHLEKNGELVAPRLWQIEALKPLIETGKVEEAEQVIAEVRKQAVEHGVKSELLAYFNHDAANQLEETRRQQRCRDQSVPLAEKVRDNTLWVCTSPCVIPGKMAKKCYNFLLYCERAVDDFVEALQQAGYGGSVVYPTMNFPSGYDLARTGQLHGLLLNDAIGWSSKVREINHVQSILEKNGYSRLPQFVWDGNFGQGFTEHFGKFLRENFPLE